jgi:hypothetical protein
MHLQSQNQLTAHLRSRMQEKRQIASSFPSLSRSHFSFPITLHIITTAIEPRGTQTAKNSPWSTHARTHALLYIALTPTKITRTSAQQQVPAETHTESNAAASRPNLHSSAADNAALLSPAPNPITADADPVEQRQAPREQIQKQARQAGKVLRQGKWEGPTCTMCKSEEEERAAAMASAIYIWHWQRPKYLSLCCPSAVLPRAAPSGRDVVTALATGHARSATMGRGGRIRSGACADKAGIEHAQLVPLPLWDL